jgi:ubiquinone/menaquinone biosynthesis C-methylase UbiE
MLKIARKNCHKIMKVDITKGLPFKDSSFNFLLCSDVLEHIDNPIFLLKEIYRVCKRKANIVIKIPNGWFDFLFILEDHKKLFTKFSFEKLLENCKFKIIRGGEMSIIPFLRKVVSFPQYLVYVLKKM